MVIPEEPADRDLKVGQGSQLCARAGKVCAVFAREPGKSKRSCPCSALVTDNRWFSSPYNDQYDTAWNRRSISKRNISCAVSTLNWVTFRSSAHPGSFPPRSKHQSDGRIHGDARCSDATHDVD